MAVQLKRKPHAQYGLQIFPKTQRKACTKIVRQDQKYDQNLDFLISLQIDIWALPRGTQGLQELENDQKWFVEYNSLGSIE